MAHSPRILIVAPEDDERAAINKALARDFEIVDAADFARAEALLSESHFSLIVMKSAASPQKGIDFIKRVRADKRQFQNSRDYMVRIDDMLACRSCRKRFDIPSSQSVVFI